MRGVLAAVLLAAWPAFAQMAEPAAGLGGSRWLARSGDLAAQLSFRPAEVLRSEQAGGRASLQVELGRLAFRSPQIFGGAARREGLTCDSCHASGHVNAGFFIPGLSSRPGTVDVTHSLFNPWRDDQLANPIDIPSLRGAGERPSYGGEARFASLRDFIRRVVVEEFAGEEPKPWLLDALVAYVGELMPTTAPDERVTLADDLDDLGRFLAVLEAALRDDDSEKAEFVSRALRFQLGAVHQRFSPAGGEAAQRLLAEWSRALADVSDVATLAALRARIAAERTVLEAAERLSLYNPRILRRALGS
jgi:hypothetical protein